MCEGRDEGGCDDEVGVVVWERRARVVLLVWRVEDIVRDVERLMARGGRKRVSFCRDV